MQKHAGTTLFSASDIVAFLECQHLTTLQLANLVTPLARAEDDESALLIQAKGLEHEARYLASLKAQGLRVAEIGDSDSPEERARETVRVLREGPDVVFQAALLLPPLFGLADFLMRVDRPSNFGDYSYEVLDTKLSRSAKSKFAVQLAFYSDLVAYAQGVEPHAMHLALGDGSRQSFRVANYSRYFHRLRDRFLEFAGHVDAHTYPEQCSHCDFCHWRELCAARWQSDDHLNQVAGIKRVQITRLVEAGTTTVAALGELASGASISKMQAATLAKLRAQAALQLARRRTGGPVMELLALDPEQRRGFYRLPQPDAGDVFFDIEGDPFEDDGLEYLFGVRLIDDGQPRFMALWAHDRAAERVAFEELMDFLTQRLQRHPGMHVYHYAPYEPNALKRLMALHGTRESEMDDLLRRERFVDLYRIVREAMRTSEPGLSIKDIEIFYMPPREGEVKTAGASIVHYERWRTSQDPTELDKIGAYNEVDCRSTHLLRDWLLGHRPTELPWFTSRKESAEPSERANAASQRIADIEAGLAGYRESLLGGLPQDRMTWGADDHLRELVFDLLDFHRRAEKPAWWAFYARREMTEEELIEDIECLGGLERVADKAPVGVGRSLVYSFTFPEQETKLRVGSDCLRIDTMKAFGSIVALDEEFRTIEIKIGSKHDVPPKLSIGPTSPIDSSPLRNAVWRFADSLIRDDGRFKALRGLLRKDAPMLLGREPGLPVLAAGGDFNAAVLDAVLALDDSYLFVQGPPGTGKTTTGAKLIVGLLGQGRRVGVTSNSHKAINNLLADVQKYAEERGIGFSGAKRSRKEDPETFVNGRFVRDVFSNADVSAANAQLVAGTAWLFADPQFEAAIDYLFVDEAGQVSLANLVAMGTAARNVVLLGDQMQLGQPIQGVHPGRSGESTLEYLLDEQATVGDDRGVFLATSFRMHGDVCRFLSEAVYDGRLTPAPRNQARRLVLDASAHAELRPSGIRFRPVVHDGCTQRSEQEAAVVAALFDNLLTQHHVADDGNTCRMALDNILVVAPYNAQVNLLRSRLPQGARVGTIDKFQGQQAEVVIVSMTTSNGECLPRNIEFLFDKNRLNVAVSRAKCLAVVVASPELLDVRCHRPQQMELVNTLCWLREYADGLPMH